ncbi:MAG: bifunctional riboflavin kinase/FAD synthetase [Candidatus Omnitrophota bacterium]
MKTAYGLIHFRSPRKRPAVALGVFDGLHCGHQRIISRLIKEAKRIRTISLVVTFFPHPQKEDLLYSLPHRLKLLEESGVDLCLVVRFTRALRRMTAEEFLKKILLKKINPAVVFIGRNFTFGRNAEGNWQLLKEYSGRKKFKLFVMDMLELKGKQVSSSRIRGLIRAGKFSKASKLLGRPVIIFGKVTRGYSLGKRLGYPTANVDAEHEVVPPFGVYSVKVKLAGKYFGGICYIGDRPTVSSSDRNKSKGQASIEAHIFGFKGNLYGRKIQIEFVKKIRSQKKFASVRELARQIRKDIRLCVTCQAGESLHP